MKAHLLFEQSGTFKNAFKKNGIDAFDYDIQDEFGETDYIIDLFGEIEKAYVGGQSIFDSFDKEDIIIAFFPCTRFEAMITMSFRGQAKQQKKWADEQKLEYAIGLHEELHKLYRLISMLTIVAIRNDLRMIIENPYTQPHYLTTYWCIQPKLIDVDRTVNGDFYKKPTQYFFINFEPKNNFLFEPIEYVERKTVGRICSQTERSLMHPQYADRFIRQYVL